MFNSIFRRLAEGKLQYNDNMFMGFSLNERYRNFLERCHFIKIKERKFEQHPSTRFWEAEPATPEAKEMFKSIQDMDRSESLMEIAGTHRHSVEFMENGGKLLCVAVIDDELVSAVFFVERLHKGNWEANRTWLLCSTLPIMYKMRHKGQCFGQFETSVLD